MRHSTGKNILITGGTDGIGLLLAQCYSRAGNNVMITGRKDRFEAEFIQPDHYTVADQSEPDKAVEAIILQMAALGWDRLDLAVLNAGSGWSGDPFTEPVDTIAKTIAVNLAAPVALSRALYPLLDAAPRGKLVLIGSVARKGARNFATYAACKAGLHGFSRSLREEWRERIDVQIIHPGPVRTGMHEKAGFDPGAMRRFFIRPETAARAISRVIERDKSPVTVSFVAAMVERLLHPGGMSR